MSKLLVAVAACLLALCLTTQVASAQDIQVCPPGTPAGETANCPGFPSIQSAIDSAAQNSLIIIPAGAPRTEAGITITDKDLTIRGGGARNTIVQAASTPCSLPDRVFHIDGSRVSIEDLTIQNGCVLNANQSAVGGGIWSEGSLTLERVIIQNNTVVYSELASTSETAGTDETAAAASIPRGGGIFAVGSLKIINSSIISNSVSSTDGRAMGGGLYNNGTAHIINSTFSGNRAIGVPDFGTALAGGAIFNAGTLIMEYTTVVRNSAMSAGGGLQNTGDVELINNLFYANAAPEDPADCTAPAILARSGAALVPAAHCDEPVEGQVDLGELSPDTPLPIYVPSRSSASVDAGICALSKVTVDARGSARGQGNECDLGAVELGFTYMAFLKSSPPMPDLIVKSVTVEPAGDLTGGTRATIKVTIANIGNAATARRFYVDLFINPRQEPPNEGGHTWTQFCRTVECLGDEGIVWKAPPTVLPRGEDEITFTSELNLDEYVVRTSSKWNEYFTPGEVKIWAYVDSYTENGSTQGYIEERREDNNRYELPAFTVLPGRIPDAIGSAAQVEFDPHAPLPQP